MGSLLMERMKVERKIGKKEGREEGRISTFVDLVKQNILDAKRAAMMLGMPVSEFNALLRA